VGGHDILYPAIWESEGIRPRVPHQIAPLPRRDFILINVVWKISLNRDNCSGLLGDKIKKPASQTAYSNNIAYLKSPSLDVALCYLGQADLFDRATFSIKHVNAVQDSTQTTQTLSCWNPLFSDSQPPSSASWIHWIGHGWKNARFTKSSLVRHWRSCLSDLSDSQPNANPTTEYSVKRPRVSFETDVFYKNCYGTVTVTKEFFCQIILTYNCICARFYVSPSLFHYSINMTSQMLRLLPKIAAIPSFLWNVTKTIKGRPFLVCTFQNFSRPSFLKIDVVYRVLHFANFLQTVICFDGAGTLSLVRPF